MIKHTMHVIAVPDLARSAAWYRDVLGFDVKPVRDGKDWCFLVRGQCEIMAGHCPDATPPAKTGDHAYFAYLVEDDVDAFYELASANGATILKAVRDEPWGMREFALRTIDGHRIMVGQSLTAPTTAQPDMGGVDPEEPSMLCGQCHCGNIHYELEWRGDPSCIPARACQCSFCLAHGAVWTTHPASTLTITIDDPAKASTYRFGTKTADFHICAVCGIVPVVTCRIDARLYGVVNVHTVDGVDADRLDRSPADFSGEEVERRLQRREEHWIGDVRWRGPKPL